MTLNADSAQRLGAGLAALQIELTDAQRAKLLAYSALLLKWNKVYNLTAIRDASQVIELHLLDSLTVLPHLRNDEKRIADIGSGGGLPGIPLAIARPDVQISLVETVHKKTSFLQQAKIELALSNLSVHCTRVEQWQPPERQQVIISRAFSDLNQFVDLSRHLLGPQGRFLAMKGVCPEEEIAQIPPEFVVSEIIPLKLAGVDVARHLIVIESASMLRAANK